MQCLIPQGQWVVELLQCTAALRGGSGQWNSCNTLPHCLGAVVSATSAMYPQTARGQWAVELLQCAGPSAGGQGVVPMRRSLPKERDSCSALPHCPGIVGGGSPVLHCHTAQGQWAEGSATRAMHRLTAWGQWVVQLLQYSASPPGGRGHCICGSALPHRLGPVGSGTSARHYLTA